MQPTQVLDEKGAVVLGFSEREQGAWFCTTQWSDLIRAKDKADGAVAEAGFSRICESYWRPIYTYLRRTGYARADAEDLTQGFFQHLLTHDWLKNVFPGHGRFRAFLLRSLKNYSLNEYAKARAEKRGGAYAFISLDESDADLEAQSVSSQSLTPEQCFDRSWADSLMTRAVRRLEQEYLEASKGALFEVLKSIQDGQREESTYVEIGEQMGLSEGAVKAAVRRMRLRLGSIVRSEVQATLADPAQVDAELRELRQALGG